jgi:DNA helicase-4
MDEIKYAEERRLFYVALTRTKSKVYLLVNKHNPSIFIKEIEKYIKKSDNYLPL